MPDNIIDVPYISPIRFFPQEDPEYPGYFNAPWKDTVPPQHMRPTYGPNPAIYARKWFNDGNGKFDPIRLQVASTFTPIQIEIMDCNHNPLSAIPGALINNPAVVPGYNLYEWNFEPPATVGRFYLRLSVGVDSGDPENPGTIIHFISEAQEVIKSTNGTLLFRYSNTFNDFDVVFGTGIEFYYRVEGWIGRPQPKVQAKNWIDQPLNEEVIKAKSFTEWPVNIGQRGGVPDYVAVNINDILCCDTVYINEVQYTRPEGNEVQLQESIGWPLATWLVILRLTKNRRSLRAQNNFSPAEFFLVTFNIDTRLFGTQNAPPSNNPVTITTIE